MITVNQNTSLIDFLVVNQSINQLEYLYTAFYLGIAIDITKKLNTYEYNRFLGNNYSVKIPM